MELLTHALRVAISLVVAEKGEDLCVKQQLIQNRIGFHMFQHLRRGMPRSSSRFPLLLPDGVVRQWDPSKTSSDDLRLMIQSQFGAVVVALELELGLGGGGDLVAPLSVLDVAPAYFATQQDLFGARLDHYEQRPLPCWTLVLLASVTAGTRVREGQGRPLTAVPSDKSQGGRRRLRPARVEGAGRPLTAVPSDRLPTAATSEMESPPSPRWREGHGRPLSSGGGARDNSLKKARREAWGEQHSGASSRRSSSSEGLRTFGLGPL